MPRKKKIYPILDEMWAETDRIIAISDDKTREEQIALIYSKQPTGVECYCPHLLPEKPVGTDQYLKTPAKDRAQLAGKEIDNIRQWLAYRDFTRRENKRNREFIRNTLIPAFHRLNMPDWVGRCQEALTEHAEITPLVMNLDDIPEFIKNDARPVNALVSGVSKKLPELFERS